MIKCLFGLMCIIFAEQFSSAQPIKTPIKTVVTDLFCDSLKLVINNSKDGFIAYRYNEKQGTATVTYNTVLPSLGFDKKYVQTGLVTPYEKSAAATLPYYIATTRYADLNVANQTFNTIKRKLITCLKPVAQDSTVKPGFGRYTIFQVSKAVKDSFVTVELLILPDGTMNILALRIYHSKGSLAKGNMQSPPMTVSTNSSKGQVLPAIQALLEYAPNNFTAIRGVLLQNQKWNPTYASTFGFSDFMIPKIEYVTKNLWNQYTTDLFFKDQQSAKQRFNELAEEIEQCKSTITYQRYETRSTPDEKWWYYHHSRKDVEGKNYHNALRLAMKKSEYGAGYYITFEFRKSTGE